MRAQCVDERTVACRKCSLPSVLVNASLKASSRRESLPFAAMALPVAINAPCCSPVCLQSRGQHNSAQPHRLICYRVNGLQSGLSRTGGRQAAGLSSYKSRSSSSPQRRLSSGTICSSAASTPAGTDLCRLLRAQSAAYMVSGALLSVVCSPGIRSSEGESSCTRSFVCGLVCVQHLLQHVSCRSSTFRSCFQLRAHESKQTILMHTNRALQI